MSKETTALQLAEILREEGVSWWDEKAADALVRLHEQNAEMLAALKLYVRWCDASNNLENTFFHRVELCQESEVAARAAIKKAGVV